MLAVHAGPCRGCCALTATCRRRRCLAGTREWHRRRPGLRGSPGGCTACCSKPRTHVKPGSQGAEDLRCAVALGRRARGGAALHQRGCRQRKKAWGAEPGRISLAAPKRRGEGAVGTGTARARAQTLRARCRCRQTLATASCTCLSRPTRASSCGTPCLCPLLRLRERGGRGTHRNIPLNGVMPWRTGDA